MNCSKFEDSISDYLDGTLARREATLFRAHSLECRSCRGTLDDVKTAIGECKQRDELETPAALEAALIMIPTEHAPLDCFGFEELVTEFLDGFVPAHTYSRFEAHAATCGDCSDLLTGVVYAVAACHSVHTYEDYETPVALVEKLQAVMPECQQSVGRKVADLITGWAGHLIPSATQGARWSFATAGALAFATFALLLFGFSDDRTVGGIYRQAHVKAGQIYSQGAGIYAQKDAVVAQLQQVGSGIEEIWDTLGGESGAARVSDNDGIKKNNPKQETGTVSPANSTRKN